MVGLGLHQGPALSVTRGPVPELRRASASIFMKCANDGPQRVLVRMENMHMKHGAHSRSSAGVSLPSPAQLSLAGVRAEVLQDRVASPHSLPSGLSGGEPILLARERTLAGAGTLAPA